MRIRTATTDLSVNGSMAANSLTRMIMNYIPSATSILLVRSPVLQRGLNEEDRRESAMQICSFCGCSPRRATPEPGRSACLRTCVFCLCLCCVRSSASTRVRRRPARCRPAALERPAQTRQGAREPAGLVVSWSGDVGPALTAWMVDGMRPIAIHPRAAARLLGLTRADERSLEHAVGITESALGSHKDSSRTPFPGPMEAGEIVMSEQR
jgi:hypothetical protein